MASMQRVPPERHFGFQCRSCSVVDFPGRRYTCGVCTGYNLCGDCVDANLLPEAPQHLYYHPLKVYYARAAYHLYFDGDGENYSAENPALQSYKCALCEVRGLTGAFLYKHIMDNHRSHPDYNAYIDLMYTYNQSQRPYMRATLMTDSEIRENRALAEFLNPSLPTVVSGRSTQSSRRVYCEDGLNLAQLLVHLKMLNLTSPEFPMRCVDILKRAHSLRAQQRGQEVVKTAEKYVNLIEHEVAAGFSERRMRLGRGTSVRSVQRNGATILLPAPNATAGMLTPAPQSGNSRNLFNGLRGLDAMVEIDELMLPGLSPGHGKYRQALVASKTAKVSQDIEDEQVQNKDSDKGRFLCSQFMVETKPTKSSRNDVPSQQKAGFVEALLCSMLSDEELTPLPFKPFRVDAIKKESLPTEPRKKVTISTGKPQKQMNLPKPQPFMNDMIRFYKALDEYKTKMENPNIDPSTVADNGAENNDQLSIMEVPLDSNGDGDGNETGNESESASDVNPENQNTSGSDSELLELTMASIIQGIDAIIDDD